jgi:hypothetical protein
VQHPASPCQGACPTIPEKLLLTTARGNSCLQAGFISHVPASRHAAQPKPSAVSLTATIVAMLPHAQRAENMQNRKPSAAAHTLSQHHFLMRSLAA